MAGTNVKIFNEKLYFRENASSKINSLENFDYKPKSSDIQIFNDHLPWLKYNKPNLPEEIKYQIEKKEYRCQTESQVDKTNEKETEKTLKENNTDKPLKKLKINKSKIPLQNENKEELHKIKHDSDNTAKKVHNSKGDSINNFVIKTNSVGNNHTNSNTKRIINRKQTNDASTETDKIFHKSVEIQTTLHGNPSNHILKKLKRTMLNSSTVPGRDLNEIPEYQPIKSYGTKYTNYKKRSELKHSKSDDLITSELIDVILPSLPHSSNETLTKHYSTYTFSNPYNKYSRSGEVPVSNKFAVTHVGINFLDQYWAAQRKHVFNKENHHFRNELTNHDSQASTEIEYFRFPHSDSTTASTYSQEMRNKKIDFYTSKSNAEKSTEKVDKITSRNLGKVMV